jgi:hypothetical protein
MFKLKTKTGGRSANITANIVFDKPFLDKVGKVIRDEIVKEARKQSSSDLRKSKGERRTHVSEEDQHDVASAPEGIPRSERFYDSFKWRVVNTKVEVYSDWPWVNQIVDGRSPYKMTWLTQSKGVDRVPFTDPTGKVKILSTPASVTDAWIHPGFASHDFIQKGWKNAQKEVKKMYALQTFRNGIQKAFKR